MNKYIDALLMAQGMFTVLPTPRRWNEGARKYMLLFLPLIGLEAGAVWYLAGLVMQRFSLPAPLFSIIMTALPVIFTGFIHMDGFMDVCDAIGSWRTLEKRREILKDSHVGSCAVIFCVLALLGMFASFLSFDGETKLSLLIIIPVVSRCCSSLALLTLKPMETSGYAGKPLPPVWVKRLMAVLITVSVTTSPVVFGVQGICVAVGVVSYALCLRKAYRLLEGMNGDISGFCLTVSELAAAAALAVL